MPECIYNDDCAENSYCNHVFHDCQQCLVICHPGRKEFGECETSCPEYVMPPVTMTVITSDKQIDPTSPIQLQEGPPSSSDVTVPLIPIAASLIAIMALLVLILVVVILHYLRRSNTPQFCRNNMNTEYRKSQNMDKYQESMMRTPIYKGDKNPRKAPSPPYNTTVKNKGDQTGNSNDLESLLVHTTKDRSRNTLSSQDNLIVKIHAEKRKPKACLPSVLEYEQDVAVSHQCISTTSKPSHNLSTCYTMKELGNSNKSVGSGRRQERAPCISTDQLGANTHCGEIFSQTINRKSSHKATEVKHTQQEVCNVISFRDVNDTSDVSKSQVLGQETLVKEFSSAAEDTPVIIDDIKFTLDATPDVNPARYEPVKSQAKLHPNRVIYDILKGIDWVQGYYSEGHSVEVYADFDYISEQVAMKELTVRTGEGPQKFHLRQSDANSYY